MTNGSYIRANRIVSGLISVALLECMELVVHDGTRTEL